MSPNFGSSASSVSSVRFAAPPRGGCALVVFGGLLSSKCPAARGGLGIARSSGRQDWTFVPERVTQRGGTFRLKPLAAGVRDHPNDRGYPYHSMSGCLRRDGYPRGSYLPAHKGPMPHGIRSPPSRGSRRPTARALGGSAALAKRTAMHTQRSCGPKRTPRSGHISPGPLGSADSDIGGRANWIVRT